MALELAQPVIWFALGVLVGAALWHRPLERKAQQRFAALEKVLADYLTEIEAAGESGKGQPDHDLWLVVQQLLTWVRMGVRS